MSQRPKRLRAGNVNYSQLAGEESEDTGESEDRSASADGAVVDGSDSSSSAPTDGVEPVLPPSKRRRMKTDQGAPEPYGTATTSTATDGTASKILYTAEELIELKQMCEQLAGKKDTNKYAEVAGRLQERRKRATAEDGSTRLDVTAKRVEVYHSNYMANERQKAPLLPYVPPSVESVCRLIRHLLDQRVAELTASADCCNLVVLYGLSALHRACARVGDDKVCQTVADIASDLVQFAVDQHRVAQATRQAQKRRTFALADLRASLEAAFQQTYPKAAHSSSLQAVLKLITDSWCKPSEMTSYAWAKSLSATSLATNHPTVMYLDAYGHSLPRADAADAADVRRQLDVLLAALLSPLAASDHGERRYIAAPRHAVTVLTDVLTNLVWRAVHDASRNVRLDEPVATPAAVLEHCGPWWRAQTLQLGPRTRASLYNIVGSAISHFLVNCPKLCAVPVVQHVLGHIVISDTDVERKLVREHYMAAQKAKLFEHSDRLIYCVPLAFERIFVGVGCHVLGLKHGTPALFNSVARAVLQKSSQEQFLAEAVKFYTTEHFSACCADVFESETLQWSLNRVYRPVMKRFCRSLLAAQFRKLKKSMALASRAHAKSTESTPVRDLSSKKPRLSEES